MTVDEASQGGAGTHEIWIRVNGIGHAFSRELGCTCGRCTTIARMETPPTGLEEEFSGWPDPPSRAHTSASVLARNRDGIQSHVLIDCGAGTVDSLACSRLAGLENVPALLITHWHPDHVLGLNQFAESVRRTKKRRGDSAERVPTYCTRATHDHLVEKAGFKYEFGKLLEFREVQGGTPFPLPGIPSAVVTPVSVTHGTVKGAVIYAIDFSGKRVVFCWDIDVPIASLDGSPSNAETISRYGDALRNPDILFVAANTYEAAYKPDGSSLTGHTSYQMALEGYIRTLTPARTFLVHMSGHEDRDAGSGFGWTDDRWDQAVAQDGVRAARQGMLLRV